ncbi:MULTISPECIES: BGTF surface domain-containing protein [Halorussus]|uniref:BGTF surface domain-containing protein n=1 Tax=Halorussus TaxID=1070314 RepID=UPI0013B42BC9|nr:MULTISPECIES: BGTF surface domain-containing protein [Halorussus]NHN59813.1 PGF-CTERM sorting domain-containing protein [Halorussus sp. JP-T4]
MSASADLDGDAYANTSNGEIEIGSTETQIINVAGVTDAGNSDTVTIDISEATDAGLDVSVDSLGANVLDNEETGLSGDTLTLDLADDTDNETVSVTLSLDATGDDVEEDSRIRYGISSDGDSLSSSATASFKVIDSASADRTFGGGDSATIYAGETITFNTEGEPTNVVTIYENTADDGTDWEQVDRFSTAPGNLVNYDTSDLEGEFVVTYDDEEPDSDDSSNSQTVLEVNPLDLEATAQDVNITTEEDIVVDASSADFGGDFSAELYEEGTDFEDNDALTSEDETFDGTGEATVNLGNISEIEDQGAGEYVVRVVHDATGVEVTTDTLNVTEAGDASVSVPQDTIYQERGDVANVSIELENRDDAYVQLGGDSSNFMANFTVVDEDGNGYVNLSINTYDSMGATAITGDNGFVSVTSDDDFISTSGANAMSDDHGIYVGNPLEPVGDGEDEVDALDNPMAAGNYDLVVAQANDDRDSKTILSVSDPSVDEVNTWVHEGVSATNLPDSGELDELLNGVAETDTIANGDYVVVETQVSGIYGYIGDAGFADDETTPGDDTVYLNLTQTNAGPNTNGNTLYGGDAEKMYFDAGNNTVYAVFPDESGDFSDGQEYKADFHVPEENAAYKNDQNASAEFEVAERSIEFSNLNSSDILEVEASENASVEGTTNLAPGTAVDVELESSGQLFTKTVEVGDNGTISATFDLSGQDVGTELSALLSADSDTEATADAVVVEQVDDGTDETTTSDGGEDTSTTTTTTTTTTTEETTTEETTTEETTTTSSDGGIPGFGVAVSLVALVAAALLALRRSN